MGFDFKKFIATVALAAVFLTAVPMMAAALEEHGATPTPPFTLKTTTGEEWSLESQKGKPLTVVVFFATWNPRSKTILAEMKKLETKLKGKGLSLFAVNSESESVPAGFDSTLAAYMKEAEVDYPVMKDVGLNVFRAWEIKAMPTTYMFDKDLKLIMMVAGAPSTIHETLFDAAEKALGIAVEKPGAFAPPTRYQAGRSEMLNYGLAEKLLERGSPHKALEKLTPVTEKDPKFPDAFALLGITHLSISEEGESSNLAREAFAKALELNPELPAAILGSAYFSALDGDSKASIEKARAAFSRTAWGFTKKPDDDKIKEYIEKLDKAAAFLASGKNDEANTELGAVLEDFVVVRKRVKVDQKRLREKYEKASRGLPQADDSGEEKSEPAAGKAK